MYIVVREVNAGPWIGKNLEENASSLDEYRYEIFLRQLRMAKILNYKTRSPGRISN